MADNPSSMLGIGTNQNINTMTKIILIVSFIICEVLMLGVGTALASGVGFTIFTVGALIFGIDKTIKQ